MKINGFNINVTSDDPDRLRAFYRDIVGLEPNPMIGPAGYSAAGVGFVIDGHSETRGKAKEPSRLMFNFHVDDIRAEQARLERLGVKFVRPATQEPWSGYMATFEDPDGNYAQLIQFPTR
jgi:predicted enzyme related to lactoylglutathione lyase